MIYVGETDVIERSVKFDGKRWRQQNENDIKRQ